MGFDWVCRAVDLEPEVTRARLVAQFHPGPLH